MSYSCLLFILLSSGLTDAFTLFVGQILLQPLRVKMNYFSTFISRTCFQRNIFTIITYLHVIDSTFKKKKVSYNIIRKWRNSWSLKLEGGEGGNFPYPALTWCPWFLKFHRKLLKASCQQNECRAKVLKAYFHIKWTFNLLFYVFCWINSIVLICACLFF